MTQEGAGARGWKGASKAVGCGGGKSPPHEGRDLTGGGILREDAESSGPRCREKPLTRRRVPVPQTDTGRRGEDPKVRGETLVKELGKMYP